MPQEWFNKPPLSTAGTPPHQDNYYFCLNPCNVLTIWMALDVVDDENACMRYVAGSHLEGVRPHARSIASIRPNSSRGDRSLRRRNTAFR